ncbi:MAG: glycosyltransferase [Leptolyngbyaceae cyanobacterium MAG.088]|nr:glycosyltransferase [Leptolyngbyaceae cyanobacterium MAG.088]
MSITKKRLKVFLYGNFFGAYRSENLVKYLLDKGYRTAIVAPEFYYERGEKKDLLTKVMRLLFSGYYFIELFIYAALADVVYLLPLNSSLIRPVVWASRLFKTKLVVEMYVSAYDTLVRERKEIEKDSAAAQKLRKNDSLALSAADYVVHLARYELSYWEQLFEITLADDKIAIAPLFCEPSLTKMQHQAKREGCLRICWWGTLIPTHGMSNILQALHQLQKSGIDFSCQLFGAPPKGKEFLLKKYQSEIDSLGIAERVSLRQDLKFSDDTLPRYLVDNCDLALGTFGNTQKAQASVPNKLIEALILGIPVLTMRTPALEEFFTPGVDFWSCEATPEAMADAITKIDAQTAYSVDWPKTRQQTLEIFCLDNYRRAIDQSLKAMSQ